MVHADADYVERKEENSDTAPSATRNSMSLGIAAVVIFVLYLIDKNSQWRAAGKVAVGVVILAVIAAVGVIGYDKVEAWEAVRAASARHAEDVKACVERNIKIDPTSAEGIRQACEAEPGAVVGPLLDQPTGTFRPTGTGKGVNSITCALDTNGRVVLDDKGGCIPPPSAGFRVDAPCWTAPAANGLQFDQNTFKDLNGRPIPPKPNRVCYPLTKK